MQVHELALQRDKYRHLSDDEWRWMLQQVEGRERTVDKLPSFAAIDDWWYPVRISCEQCSSELTARYKKEILSTLDSRLSTMADLTGGYGVDTYFLSERFEKADYVEQNSELCRIVEHNFCLQSSAISRQISVHNTSAEDFLQTAEEYDLIFLDPARRDSQGGKVFRLEDCTPNVVSLLPQLEEHLSPQGRLMLKLSPMLDITQAVTVLSTLSWDVHVVAVKNEVKEVLLLSGGKGTITAIDLDKPDQAFVFRREEEQLLTLTSCHSPFDYLYEPNAAILKAGGYKLVAERFGLEKADTNTHLYFSDRLVEDFPGRVWKIAEPVASTKNANVLVRNYPLTAEQLKKKLHLRDGGTAYAIGCRVAGKPTIFWAERVI